MSGPARIRLRNGHVYEADDAHREGGAIVATARRSRWWGVRGDRTHELGPLAVHLWPLREILEVRWTGERDDA